MNYRYLISIFIMCFCVKAHCDNIYVGECKVFNGTIISTWLLQDNAGEILTYGAVGNIGNPPNTWTVQDITAGAHVDIISKPKLVMNSLGDVMAYWIYYDWVLKVNRVAAARLPSGQTTWVVNTVSGSTSTKSSLDEHLNAAIDDNGNLFIVWTCFDYTTQNFIVEGARGTIAGAWNTPELIGQ
jgi:hypothetical protein